MNEAARPRVVLFSATQGDLYTKISDADAFSALQTAVDCGVGFFDTSPWYGLGLSEARMGVALHRVPRTSFAFQTKVGRYLVPDVDCTGGTKVGWIGGFHFGIRFDYSGAAFEAQLLNSLQRTGLGYIDSLVIHDLEPANFGHDLAATNEHLNTLRRSGFPALQRMRAQAGVHLHLHLHLHMHMHMRTAEMMSSHCDCSDHQS